LSKIPARNSESPLHLVNVKNVRISKNLFYTNCNIQPAVNLTFENVLLKVTNDGERSWLIELTSEDCTAPAADFSLDLSALTGGLSRADVMQVQAHSDQIAGNVVLNVRDQQIVFR
jgi:hypothetical protein